MSLTTQISDLDLDPSIFEPLKTSDPVLNDFISNDGGPMPATATMVTGHPGSGKTTLLCEMLSDVQVNGGEVLFISMEMNEIDMASYTKRFPHWDSLPIYFPDFENDIFEDVKTLLEQGFDMVAIDSFKELKDIVADEKGWTKTRTERELITLMNDAMIDENDTGTHTCFYVIQQVLKSGDFAGSKRLEHLMTANLKMVVEDNESHLIFEKNRRGDAHRKLFYRIKENEIVFDGERRQTEEDAIEFTEKERERQQKQQQEFDSIDDLLNEGSGDDQLPTSNGQLDTEVEDELVEIENDVDGPVTDKENVDSEIFERVYRYEDGNINAVRETLHDIGAAPELTWYYADKLATEYGLKND
jgi:KaiC/GvpD/RAD55 family RecA-like ATPase